MKIIGCDFHPSFQQIAICDLETGELQELQLCHGDGQAERFYRELGKPALIGIEATGNSQWFLDLVQRLGHEIRVGDAAKIRASYVRKQKTDKRDAGQYLEAAVRETVSPVVDAERSDAGSTAVVTPPGQAGRDPNQGEEQPATPCDEPGDAEEESAVDALWDGAVPTVGDAGLGGDATGRFVAAAQGVEPPDRALDQAVKQAAEQHPQAQLLMTQPGVGPVTALAFVLTVGDVARFAGSKQLTSYLGLVPSEHSSGSKRHLGAITKQGNRFLRKLLVEAAQTTVRKDEGFRKEYQRRCHRRPKGVAKVAAARKLAVRLYWMLRSNVSYPEIARVESNPRVPLGDV
jgi:transposase